MLESINKHITYIQSSLQEAYNLAAIWKSPKKKKKENHK